MFICTFIQIENLLQLVLYLFLYRNCLIEKYGQIRIERQSVQECGRYCATIDSIFNSLYIQ